MIYGVDHSGKVFWGIHLPLTDIALLLYLHAQN
jgi:hypothetical protein